MHDKPFQMEVCIEGGTKDGHRGHDPYPTYRKRGGGGSPLPTFEMLPTFIEV